MKARKRGQDMSSALQISSFSNRTPKRKRPATDESRIVPRKRKSLRLQHSVSLHVPIDELNGSAYHMNCYIDIETQCFNLTFLGDNETQNPNSLQCLEEFKRKKWQIYLAGNLYNFNYKPEQLRSMSKSIKTTLFNEFQNSNRDFSCNVEVTKVEGFNPTDNDKEALKITVIKQTGQKETSLYEGYLVSWCNPLKSDGVLLPILICAGNKKYQSLIHTVLSEKLDITVTRLSLTQEEFLRLSSYCLVMLDENDSYNAKFTYGSNLGTASVEVAVQHLLKLWKTIHKDDSIEVELDEVLLFGDSLERFVLSSFGINLGCLPLQSVTIPGCFSLYRNGQVKLTSTKVVHVVLKYLNYLAVQRLKTKALGFATMENSSRDLRSV